MTFDKTIVGLIGFWLVVAGVTAVGLALLADLSCIVMAFSGGRC